MRRTEPCLPARLKPRDQKRRRVAFKTGAAAAMAVLTVCDDGKADGELVRVRRDRLVIGRGDGDVRIPHDAMMSTRHAEIVSRSGSEQLGGWVVADLQSTTELCASRPRAVQAWEAKSSSAAPCSASRTRPLTCPALALATATTGSALRPKLRAGKLWRPPTSRPLCAGAAAGNRQARTFWMRAEQWLGREPLSGRSP